MSTLSIIIVNWNTRELIIQCLDSLSPLRNKTEIIVVDNASSDGSPYAILELFPWVRLIQNNKNLGYAAGNNIGAEVANGDYLLLLNSDTIPNPEAILKMVKFLDNNHEISAIGPFLRLGNGDAQVGAAGWDLDIKSAFNYQSMLHRIYPKFFKAFYLHQPAFAKTDKVIVDWVSGAAMMVRHKIFQSVNGIPEQYFMYGEDIDFCRRIRTTGQSIVYLPNIEIIHLHGQSSNKKNISTQWLKTTLLYHQSIYGIFLTRIVALIFAAGSLLRALIAPFMLANNYNLNKNKVRQYLAYFKESFSIAISKGNRK